MTVPQVYTLIVLAAIGAIFCAMQVRRALRESSERDRIIAEARERVGLPPAAPDNVEGTNVADLDECALILHAAHQLEAEMAAFCDRLRDAIRDHRTEDTP